MKKKKEVIIINGQYAKTKIVQSNSKISTIHHTNSSNLPTIVSIDHFYLYIIKDFSFIFNLVLNILQLSFQSLQFLICCHLSLYCYFTYNQLATQTKKKGEEGGGGVLWEFEDQIKDIFEAQRIIVFVKMFKHDR